jgi:predicted RND superfamily exporter protein
MTVHRGVLRIMNQSRLDRLSWFLTRHRLAVLLLVSIVTVAFCYGTLKIRSDVILQHMFPYDHPYLKLHARFSQVFGSGASGVAIALKAKDGDIFNQGILSKLQKMTNEVVLWDEIYRVLTVSIASRTAKVVKALAKGEIKIDPLMWPDIPQNTQEMSLLKKHIFADPAHNGTLVARDGTAALLLTEFKENISYERAFSLLRQLTQEYTDDETSVHIVGFPQLMGWIYSFRPQMRIVFAISVGLIILILFLIFRNFTGMVAPLVVGLISTGIGLGFIGWIGINFSPLLYVLAFLVGARKISHAVQITHRYLEELNDSGNDKDQACYKTMRSMIMPNVAGVTTDAAGFFVLILAKIVLMQHLAIIMSFWMLSIAFSAILTPIICTYIPLTGASEKWSKERTRMDWFDRANMAGARFSMGSGRYVFALVVIGLLVFCGWQTSKLKIGDPTPGSPLLWPDQQYNQDQALVDRTFDASSENLMLFYEGERESVYDPAVLTTFEAFARHMKARLPDIYKSSTSIINMVKMVNVTFHDGDKLWYQLPRNEPMLTGLMGYVKTNVGFTTTGRYIDEGMERAQITLFFSDHTSENLLRIRDAAYDFFKNHPMKIEKGEFKLAGGRIGLEIAVNEEMKASHVKIDSMVLITIFIMCMLCFRSIVAGLMLTLPLIIANLVAFAYMAVTNIGLSINTLPVAAVGVGVGVDFAIYIYSRCIEEFPQQDGWINTILTAVRTSGKAVVYTGLTLILAIIPWYFISDLKFQAQMGFFLSMLLLANVVLAITLHPLLIYLLKPRFIRRCAVSNGGGGEEQQPPPDLRHSDTGIIIG